MSLAGCYLAEVVFVGALKDRSVLLVFYAHGGEVLFDVCCDREFIDIADLALAVDHYVGINLYGTVQTGLLRVECEDELTDLVGFDGRQGHLVDQERLSLVDGEIHVMIGFREVRVFEFAALALAFLNHTEVQHFGLHVQVAYCLRVFVHRLGLFGDHLTLDEHFLGCLRGVGGDGHGLLETSRTAIGIIGHGDLAALTRLYRLFGP